MVEKRRRKKARIQAESSSESEPSSDEHAADLPSELSELSEDEYAAPAAGAGAAGGAASGDTHAAGASESHPRERLRKTPHDSPAEFSQAYLRLVTEQFGEDLAALREANDFGPASISQLVAGLKQGVDIFSPEQQRMLGSSAP